MNAAVIPEDAIPALIEALRDPELQVRANAAHALARLDPLPEEAIPPLIECTADAHDGLRMNAAMALKRAPVGAVDVVMQHLVADPNSRVRLIAASFLLAAGLGDHRIVTTLCPGGKERMRRLMEVVRAGRVDLTPLLTLTFPLERIGDAYDLFGERLDGVLKVAVKP